MHEKVEMVLRNRKRDGNSGVPKYFFGSFSYTTEGSQAVCCRTVAGQGASVATLYSACVRRHIIGLSSLEQATARPSSCSGTSGGWGRSVFGAQAGVAREDGQRWKLPGCSR